MPWIHPNTFCAIAAHAADDRIVIPVHRGRRGHPVAFGADFFPALAQLDGDVGARQLVAAHAAAVRELAVADAGILRDVDRPSDLCDQ